MKTHIPDFDTAVANLDAAFKAVEALVKKKDDLRHLAESLATEMLVIAGLNHARYGNDPPGLWDAAVVMFIRALKI